jgi:phosphate transport system permease protein
MQIKRRQTIGEWGFKKLLVLCGLALVVMLGLMLFTLIKHSWLSISVLKWDFIKTSTWDPLMHIYGAKPFVIGTLITATLALLISWPFSLAVSIFLGEYATKGVFSDLFKAIINMLAGIPSVIYGFWGLFVIVPLMRNVQSYFGLTPFGIGIATAAIILAIMIIPYSAAIGRDVIALVPNDLKEGAYSLGATRMEVMLNIVLPTARSGLLAGTLLAFGRAIGETMAVTMVIGNSNLMPTSIFEPGNTMASIIANEFSEATDLLHTSALIELGLYLFVISAIINLIGKWIINKTEIAQT